MAPITGRQREVTPDSPSKGVCKYTGGHLSFTERTNVICTKWRWVSSTDAALLPHRSTRMHPLLARLIHTKNSSHPPACVPTGVRDKVGASRHGNQRHRTPGQTLERQPIRREALVEKENHPGKNSRKGAAGRQEARARGLPGTAQKSEPGARQLPPSGPRAYVTRQLSGSPRTPIEHCLAREGWEEAASSFLWEQGLCCFLRIPCPRRHAALSRDATLRSGRTAPVLQCSGSLILGETNSNKSPPPCDCGDTKGQK